MEPGSIRVSRTLPIDGALLGDVLLRLRRDSSSAPLRWTLGECGAAEVDVNFVSETSGGGGETWSTPARVWDASGRSVAAVALLLTVTAPDAVELSLEPTVALTPLWQRRRRDLLDLARAALDELSEELLWHAARAGVASRG